MLPVTGARLESLPPLSLYVHIPWCIRKCPYCDFNSHQAPDELPEKAYVDALLRDLTQDLPLAQGRPLASIFIGGGTPSLLSPEAMHRLLDGIRACIPLAAKAEVTLEANPGTFEQARFAGFHAAGINRLSLGIQSFSDQQLRALGRVHDAAEARAAIDAARRIGFDNLNLDLMHGLPGQTPEGALADLAAALSFAPDHLSWYQLTLEPNTEFYSRPPRLPEEEALWEIQERGLDCLEAAGYQHYEISAHCRPERASQHNLNYWRFGDYLGIGAGAHSKLTDLANQQIIRLWKLRQPKAYLGAPLSYRGGERTIAPEERPLEFLMNALRLRQGVESALFQARTGLPLAVIEAPLRQARALELLEPLPGRLQPSSRGQLFLNDLLDLFLDT